VLDVRVRLSDLAAQAGVSEATVSRVLNARPGVAPDTRQAVLAALDLLGYERPAALRTRSAGLIGLVIPVLDNPIFPVFAQAISSLLAQHDYTPVLCTTAPGGVVEDDYVELLLERGVSGIVFVSGMHADTSTDVARYQALVDRALPMVLINGYREGIDAAFVSDDDGAAATVAVSHLASLGHTRIGLAVGPERHVPVIRRTEAYLAAMRDVVGLEPGEAAALVSNTMFTVEGGQAAAVRLLEKHVTAIVCGSDMMALGAVRAVRAAGLDVPRDVSVVGYDDSALIAFTDPPLTTVRQSVQAMAAAAVHALLDEIGGAPAPRVEYVFRPELVVRGSTAAAPHLRVPRPSTGVLEDLPR
jgi:DNA-binding LacI/PurR family transcriptional regulator